MVTVSEGGGVSGDGFQRHKQRTTTKETVNNVEAKLNVPS